MSAPSPRIPDDPELYLHRHSPLSDDAKRELTELLKERERIKARADALIASSTPTTQAELEALFKEEVEAGKKLYEFNVRQGLGELSPPPPSDPSENFSKEIRRALKEIRRAHKVLFLYERHGGMWDSQGPSELQPPRIRVKRIWDLMTELFQKGLAKAPPLKPSVTSIETARDAINIAAQWLEKQTTPVQEEASATRVATPPAHKGKRINEQMLAELTENPESCAWSVKEWADRFGCSKSTVQGTTAWKRILTTRKLSEAERYTLSKSYKPADRRRIGGNRSAKD